MLFHQANGVTRPGFFLAVWTKTQGNQNSILSKLKRKFPETQAKLFPKLNFSENFLLEKGPTRVFCPVLWFNCSILMSVSKYCQNIQGNSSITQGFFRSKLKKIAKTQIFGKCIHLLCRPNGQKTSLT